MSTAETLAMNSTQQNSPPKNGPTLVTLLPSSILTFVYPPASRRWTSASMARACLVAFVNTVSLIAWLYIVGVILTAWQIHDGKGLNWTPGNEWHLSTYVTASTVMRSQLAEPWSHANILDRSAVFGGVVITIALSYAVIFFMLLPFGARPGSNCACIKHVLKTTLLGTGLIHWWGAAYAVVFFLYLHKNLSPDMTEYATVVGPLLFVFAILFNWHLATLIYSVRREYRKPPDFPKPHDPWCDVCGYNLTGIATSGRCPECGKPILESLGNHVRPPTNWENRPTLLNFSAVLHQLTSLVTQPLALYYKMPTLTGQRQAQRFLLFSLLIIFITALAIVPALYILMNAEWNMVAISGTLAMATVWTAFALMMVGIETGGIATFSRMRGHPGGGVYLAAAAKVTSYTAILMVAWVLLGGTQLVAYAYFTTNPHNLIAKYHIGYFWAQLILGVSLAISHIGGLLWYELTVYRGVKAIQYANK